MLNDITNRVCTINDAVGEDGSGNFERDFLAVGEPTAFVLKSLSLGGGLVGFQAIYVGKNPPAFWLQPINLVSRGASPATLAPGSQAPLLPPWQAAQGTANIPPLRQAYLTALGTLSSWDDGHPSYQRLEGDVQVGEETEAVTLYFFPAGMVNDKDFVFIEVTADQSEVGTRQSGIAHGNL